MNNQHHYSVKTINTGPMQITTLEKDAAIVGQFQTPTIQDGLSFVILEDNRLISLSVATGLNATDPEKQFENMVDYYHHINSHFKILAKGHITTSTHANELTISIDDKPLCVLSAIPFIGNKHARKPYYELLLGTKQYHIAILLEEFNTDWEVDYFLYAVILPHFAKVPLIAPSPSTRQ